MEEIPLKYKRILIFLLLGSSLSSALELQENVFKKGDKIKIEQCNAHLWCKIEKTPFYIKGFFFHSIGGSSIFEKKSERRTFLYVKNSYFDNNEMNSILKASPDDTSEQKLIRLNKSIGYTRVNFSDLNQESKQAVLDSKISQNIEKITKPTPKPVVQNKELVPPVVATPVVSEPIESEVIASEPKVQEIQKEPQQDKSFFASIAFGLSTISSDFESSTQNVSIDEKGSNVDLGLGYRYNQNIFATLSYQRAMFDEVHIDNIYTSLNYQLQEVFLQPYIGVMLGYSQLTWDKDPITGTSDNDYTSTTPFVGLQVGLGYSFENDWSIFTQYQILKNQHNTDVSGDNLSIDLQNNLQLGVRYDF